MAEFKNIYYNRVLTVGDETQGWGQNGISVRMPRDDDPTMVLPRDSALALANHIYSLYGIEVPKPTPGDFKHGDKIVSVLDGGPEQTYQAVEVDGDFYYRTPGVSHPTLWIMRDKNNWRKA